jgi:ligand-binding SRPBCC domain-containing protein
MKILLRTIVGCPFEQVAGNFDRELFEFLLPPHFVATLVNYEGSKPGDKIHLTFKIPWKSDWISVIKEFENGRGFYYFIDEGKKLPFGLKKWRHHHQVRQLTENQTEIIDFMYFSTAFWLLDLLAWPVLFISFFPRKRLYRTYFKNLHKI